jgi:hypothetical protein
MCVKRGRKEKKKEGTGSLKNETRRLFQEEA